MCYSCTGAHQSNLERNSSHLNNNEKELHVTAQRNYYAISSDTVLITSHIKQTNNNTNYYKINSFDRFNGRFDGDLIKLCI